MTSPSIVRAATDKDLMGLWRLFLSAHHENSLFPMDSEKVQWMLNRAIYEVPLGDTGPRGVIGTIGPPGMPEAFVFLIIGQFWYSSRPHLEELVLYTDLEHRRSEHTRALIEWMKKQVEVTGLPLMTGIMSNHRTEAKVRLYSRMLPKIGAFFFLTPKGSMLPAGLATAASS